MENCPNWSEIKRCPIWKVLGVTECDNCGTKTQCWGDDLILPETPKGIKKLNQVINQINRKGVGDDTG